MLSLVLIALGDQDGAEQALHSAQAMAAESDAVATARASVALGQLASLRGEPESALHHFDDAIGRSKASGEASAHAQGLLEAARVLLDRDGPADASAAVGRLAEARALVKSEGLKGLELELRLQLARGRAATGDLDGGIEDARATEEAARDLGQSDVRWRSLATLAELEARRGAEFVARRHEQAAMEVLEVGGGEASA